MILGIYIYFSVFYEEGKRACETLRQKMITYTDKLENVRFYNFHFYFAFFFIYLFTDIFISACVLRIASQPIGQDQSPSFI